MPGDRQRQSRGQAHACPFLFLLGKEVRLNQTITSVKRMLPSTTWAATVSKVALLGQAILASAKSTLAPDDSGIVAATESSVGSRTRH